MKERSYAMSRAQAIFSVVSIAAAISLLVLVAARVALLIDLSWWTLPALVAGMAIADLMSGFVHWGADTWGNDDLPIVGRRLLKPFRLHHIEPDDLINRSFIELNGDVAFLYALALAALWLMPLDGVLSEPLLISGFGLCAIGMWTNQIHQWAHLPAPPVPVRWLQDAGVLLGRSEHAAHHSGAFDRHYCITTGWWNRPLEAIGFFRRLEAVITAISGAHPREDDRRYAV